MEFQSEIGQGDVPEVTMRCHPIYTPFQPRTIRTERNANPYVPRRIVKNGVATIVFWQDGTKTVVKRGSDEAESDYNAFCAALGIKIFGSNSALKRIVNRTETHEKKAYRFKCPDCGAEFVRKSKDISVMEDNTIKAVCPKCNRLEVFELPKSE